jgi:hypothetical protein
MDTDQLPAIEMDPTPIPVEPLLNRLMWWSMVAIAVISVLYYLR